MIIKIFIFILIFGLIALCLYYEPKVKKQSSPEPQDPILERGKYYCVSWDLRTGEIKEYNEDGQEIKTGYEVCKKD